MLVMTRTVNDKVAENSVFAKFILESIRKFNHKEWGEQDPHDRELNDADPKSAMGVYRSSNGDTIWIKSDDYGDHCVQTVLFPEEY